MKLKFVLIITIGWISQSSFAQNYTTNTLAVDNNQQQIKVSKTSENNIATEATYTRKEWKKIKREIRKNKKRISKNNTNNWRSKATDTVFLQIPFPSKADSRVTDW